MLYDQVSQQITFQLFLNVCEKNEIFADTNYGYVIGYLYISKSCTYNASLLSTRATLGESPVRCGRAAAKQLIDRQ